MKPTLLENCEEAIILEKDLHTIGVIVDDESTNNSKDMSRRSQTIVRKEQEKEASEIECFTRLVKSLTTEISKIKQQMSEKTMNNRPPKVAKRKNMT